MSHLLLENVSIYKILKLLNKEIYNIKIEVEEEIPKILHNNV
jgi:hypothetical protein